MSWTTHLLASTDPPPRPGLIAAACGKLQPDVIPMFGEVHDSLHPCLECLKICSQGMPPNSERKYFTFLIPGQRLKGMREHEL